jgi:hypothetical protein
MKLNLLLSWPIVERSVLISAQWCPLLVQGHLSFHYCCGNPPGIPCTTHSCLTLIIYLEFYASAMEPPWTSSHLDFQHDFRSCLCPSRNKDSLGTQNPKSLICEFTKLHYYNCALHCYRTLSMLVFF